MILGGVWGGLGFRVVLVEVWVGLGVGRGMVLGLRWS